MNFILVGEESLLVQCAQKLLDQRHEIKAIVSSQDQILQWAVAQAIPTHQFTHNLAQTLSDYRFDYLLSIANLRVLPADVLALPSKGAINFHDGPLPHYAGLYTTSWAIINREPTHGVTWHKIEEGIDTGEILAQAAIELSPDETAFSLNAKCYAAGIATFETLLPKLLGDPPVGMRQDPADFSYYAKNRRPETGGVVAWDQEAVAIDALIRGLSFGNYENPLMIPKVWTGQDIVLITAPAQLAAPSGQQPGTIVSLTGDVIQIATRTGDVRLPALRLRDGRPVTTDLWETEIGLREGDRLPSLDPSVAEHLSQKLRALVRAESFWTRQLARLTDVEIPYATRQLGQAQRPQTIGQQLPESDDVPAEQHVGRWLSYLARLSGQDEFQVINVRPLSEESAPFLAEQLPITVKKQESWQENVNAAGRAFAAAIKKETYPRDLVFRIPKLNYLIDKDGRLPLTIGVHVGSFNAQHPSALPENVELLLTVDDKTGALWWVFNEAVYSAEAIGRMQQQFELFVANGLQNPDQPLESVVLQSPQELNNLLVEWNDTAVSYDRESCVHDLFAAQAAVRPDQTAFIFKNEAITYREVNRRANQMAHHLQSLGVHPDTFVGVFMDRSIDMMVALLGILKAGGSYLPLDPDYPPDRLAFMVEDAEAPVIVTTHALVDRLPNHQAAVVEIEKDRAQLDLYPIKPPETAVKPHHLSYIIYTSGSTGKPKGVMVEHRNVVNFFVGMDGRIPHQPGDVWLATTSLSFDISVLELFWTITRGLTVVLHDNDLKQADQPASAGRPIKFSLFYFASDASEGGMTNKYRLLLEGAKFADTHGFEAVWTPERHFHAFGGLYPNPAITGTAVAAVTQNVKIRAGSLVSPLHHPIRITEDWSVLDNISNGRVGISFASGWQPNDFVLAPDNFANNKPLMFEQIELVKQLWRGEKVTFPGPKENVAVQTLPRPVQKELPIWVTAAGNPETFRMAGANGFNLLTHLLGQSVDDLASKLAIYRQAWRDAGHPGEGHVTLMLHTFVGKEAAQTKEMVRPHLKNYLRSAVFLIKQAAWSFPTFQQKATATGQTPLEVFESEDLSPEEMEALLDFAFERYYESSGLLGTVEKCERMVNDIKRVGVDEVACQIDFGIPSADALAALENLNHLYQLVGGGKAAAVETDFSIPALINRHAVTHFQCTPSMMSMLLIDERMPAALNKVKVCMLGGEALPKTVADPVLANLKNGRLINMYGPTETTIWSSTADVAADDSPITIGRPIANTQLYVVDGQMRPVPVGVAGELLIGGDGVVRGYHKRPELTAARFIDNPFLSDGGRVYRTGDLARFTPNGNVDFLGRLDFQVKIRGYRIELGEIESLLGRHTDVREAIVTAREDTPGDKRLVAYVIPQHSSVEERELRAYLGEFLPDFMVPSHFVVLQQFPLTPNNKTDRKALPAPGQIKTRPAAAFAPPQNRIEEKIAQIWQDLLNLPQIGVHDSFFDLGGHSLLAVQAHRLIREALNVDFSIADVFRYATIRALAGYLDNQEAAVQETQKQAEKRAAARRQALGTRVQGRRRK